MDIYLYIEFSNGEVWRIPAEVIAEQRAEYYADREEEPGTEEWKELFQEEMEFTLNNEYELKDWASNNMNWVHVKDSAEKVEEQELDKEDEWVNTDKWRKKL